MSAAAVLQWVARSRNTGTCGIDGVACGAAVALVPWSTANEIDTVCVAWTRAWGLQALVEILAVESRHVANQAGSTSLELNAVETDDCFPACIVAIRFGWEVLALQPATQARREVAFVDVDAQPIVLVRPFRCSWRARARRRLGRHSR